MSTFVKLAAAALAAAALAPQLAQAGDPCEGFWYERNAIYASAGYCFKTARAISQFGKGCFPPYGQLSASEQRRVARLKAKEREWGCE